MRTSSYSSSTIGLDCTVTETPEELLFVPVGTVLENTELELEGELVFVQLAAPSGGADTEEFRRLQLELLLVVLLLVAVHKDVKEELLLLPFPLPTLSLFEESLELSLFLWGMYDDEEDVEWSSFTAVEVDSNEPEPGASKLVRSGIDDEDPLPSRFG